MSAKENKALVQRILSAYGQSDLTPLLEAIHPDVVWTSSAPPDHYGFGGRHVGRAGALAGMAKIATAYQLNHYEIAELVAEGDVVWLTAHVDFTHRKTKTRLKFPLVSRWEIKNGQVMTLTEYYDSASLLIQEGALIAAGPAQSKA